MYRIMIVEDDEVIARTVQQSLVSWGMDAFCVQDFSGVLAEFAVKNPQLVLMDIHLPFFNGFHWCQEIRKVSKVPVIFLSSASDNMNIIMAVNMGGDDFIAKPFDLSVLTAKVQAMLRRTYEFAGETNFLEHRGAMLDTGSGVLNYRGKRIELTKNEWRILQSLLENKGKAVSRDVNRSPSSRQLKKYKFFLPVEIYLLAVFMQLASKFHVFPLALKFQDSFASVYCCSNLYNLRSFLREYLYQ